VNPLAARPHDARVAGLSQPMLTADTRSNAAPVVSSTPVAAMPMAATPPAPAGNVAAAYAAYQETMRKFLEVQERVMASVLSGAPMTASAMPAMPSLAMPNQTMPNQTMPSQTMPGSATPVPAQAATAASAQSAMPLVEAASPVPAASSQELDAAAIDALLVKAASTETGYPPDMLGRDLDLTSDLGIDSLRHVQIVTAVGEALPAGSRDRLSGEMDRLLAARTLNELASVLTGALLGTRPVAEPAPPVAPSTALARADLVPARHETACARSAPRGFVRPLELPVRPPRWRHVAITEDAMGIAALIAGALTSSGARVTLIGRGDLASSARVSAAASACADVDAVLHLAGLGAGDTLDGAQPIAKSLFQFVRALPPAATPTIVSASVLGGSFGRDGHFGPGSPLSGAAVGLLRVVAAERAGTRVKAVDFAAGDGKEAIAGRLLQELGADDDAIEVGYRPSGRAVFENVPSALAAAPSPDAIEPSGDWVVLATGGARGITGEILSSLIRPGMTVVLVGRRPLPGPEPAATSGLNEADLRRWLIDRARAEGDRATPATIDARLRAVMHDREIRGTVASLTARGARVAYHACDVRDTAAFEALINGVYEQHGRIDAVLHGAGVIDDHWLRDKTDESIDRVFDTKAASAAVLMRALHPETLRLVVMFASVAGRSGSAGQCDYAAANEVLNRMAWWMAAQWPATRVLSINWGPWSETGMATPAVQTALKARGILPIPPSQGRAFFLEELSRGSRLDVEVIAGTGPWSSAETAVAAQEGLRISRA
jgi:NAD(P)-dependent dehydrogenase (short-subunit alcohol dehydrogenase family)